MSHWHINCLRAYRLAHACTPLPISRRIFTAKTNLITKNRNLSRVWGSHFWHIYFAQYDDTCCFHQENKLHKLEIHLKVLDLSKYNRWIEHIIVTFNGFKICCFASRSLYLLGIGYINVYICAFWVTKFLL